MTAHTRDTPGAPSSHDQVFTLLGPTEHRLRKATLSTLGDEADISNT